MKAKSLFSGLVATLVLGAAFACSPSSTEGADSSRQDLGLGNIGNLPRISPCDATGERCCAADSDVPTVHCLGGAVGCDIRTNKCAPCGGANEVCCDGPHTAFNGKPVSYVGVSPDPALSPVLCADPASCDARLVAGQWEGSRTCRACGTKEGGACCGKDPRNATGRCGADATTGVRLMCADPYAADASTCVACGRLDESTCPGAHPCDDDLAARGGKCVGCGYVGQPTCDEGEPCRMDTAVPDKAYDTCVEAGGLGQPCEKGNRCDYLSLSCQGGVCRSYCGEVGLACCGPELIFQCAPGGDCRAGTCEACGGNGDVCCGGGSCVPGFYCDSHPFDPNYLARCRPAPIQDPPPPPPPPPGNLPDCSGAPWTSHLTFHVFLQLFPSRCLIDANPAANTLAEAQQCALGANPGTAVVNDLVNFYRYHSYDAQGFCTNESVGATNDGDAQTCAEADWGAGVQTGDCP